MSGGAREELMAVPDLRELSRTGVVHFMGIGGAGMSALAELVLAAGGRVSGCDNAGGEVVDRLRELGVVVVRGHHPAHLHDARALVVTAAVSPDQPELAAAREQGLPVLKRAQAMGAIVNQGRVVAVAGTHGKTTTSTMLAAVLAEGGLDPTALVGGRVHEWGGGFRPGRSDLFVVEADEYDRSFFTLAPHTVVVTSVEADHLDIYGDLAGVEAAFRDFLELVPAHGTIIACVDDPGVKRVLHGLDRRINWYGLEQGAALRALNIEPLAGRTRFDVEIEGHQLGSVELGVPGEHNVRNALAAVAAGLEYGTDFRAAQRALTSYTGVARRFQQVGEAAGITFIDDYAHHPTEVAATLAAARNARPGARIVAVFQPHLFSRTRDLAAEFGCALALADVVYLAGIYPARELPLKGVTSELLVETARSAGAEQVHYHGSLADLEQALVRELQHGDLCIAMGAGNIDAAIRRVHRLLGGRP